MNVSKDAVLRMVSAVRMADDMAKAIEMFTNGENNADLIAGKLEDVLYEISGEKFLHEDDFTFSFEDSETYRLLHDNNMTDEQVVESIFGMAWDNRPKISTEWIQPLSREEFAKSVQENGGYLCSLPEGEWS